MNADLGRGPQIGRRTDVGRVRSANEDSMGDIPISNGHILIVADGMGGYRGGAIDSHLVIEAIEEYFRDAVVEQPQKSLRQAVYLANERIYLRGQQDEDLSRMGSTCVLAMVEDGQLFLAHVGDSRIYLQRDGGKLQRLTRAHTEGQHFVDVGLLSEEEAEGHPDSHILSRALGPRAHVEPEVREEPVTLREGDRVLLCSDGLTKMMNEARIQDLLGEKKSSQEVADLLVTDANERGGEDNVTVLIFEYHQSPEELQAGIDETLEMAIPSLDEASRQAMEETLAAARAAAKKVAQTAELAASATEVKVVDDTTDDTMGDDATDDDATGDDAGDGSAQKDAGSEEPES